MTPTEEQVEVYRPTAKGIVMRLLDLRSPAYLSGYNDFVLDIATALATVRLEGWNAALSTVLKTVNSADCADTETAEYVDGYYHAKSDVELAIRSLKEPKQ